MYLNYILETIFYNTNEVMMTHVSFDLWEVCLITSSKVNPSLVACLKGCPSPLNLALWLLCKWGCHWNQRFCLRVIWNINHFHTFHVSSSSRPSCSLISPQYFSIPLQCSSPQAHEHSRCILIHHFYALNQLGYSLQRQCSLRIHKAPRLIVLQILVKLCPTSLVSIWGNHCLIS